MHDSADYDAMMHEMWAPALHRFVAVARTGHLTRAADRIGVPQPTLSRAIARLERDLGVALFHRGRQPAETGRRSAGRGLRLTPAGRTLLPRAEAALAELEAAAAELAGDADAATGRVVLGFLGTLGTEVVPALLRGFRDAHPRVRIELVQAPHVRLLEHVRDGTADLVLTAPLPDEPGLAAIAIAEEELRLAVPSGHRLDRGRAVDLGTAADEPFLLYASGYGLHDTVLAWCREAGFTPRRAFEGGETATLRALVAAGLGVALLPVAADVPGVTQVRVRAPRTIRTLGMVHAAGDRPTDPVRALRAHVAAHAPGLLSTNE